MKVATLAVGTEVTDGQVVDRNSAILSQLAVDLGLSVIEHRAVPDERAMIRDALKDLGSKVQILFVTGGLGPTSDDFTRELIAEYLGAELKFDNSSWQHVQNTLAARGVSAKDVQKQQCYFPVGATVLVNPAGTANGFSIKKDSLQIIALPGPPREIMAVWDHSLQQMLSDLVPKENRETLHLWRCLGRGESDIAELVEPIVKTSGLRVGYRASQPYVEVKLWTNPVKDSSNVISAVDKALNQFIVNRNNADLARDFLKLASKIEVVDRATAGFLAERLFTIYRDERIETDLSVLTGASLKEVEIPGALTLELSASTEAQSWTVKGTSPNGRSFSKEVKPIYLHKVESERGRRYICEKALQIALRELA
jgi:nicotinamide-nucleotide amidase